eukprot:755864-Rhodomonas_salina.1
MAYNPAGSRPQEWGFGMKPEKNAQGLVFISGMLPGGAAEQSGKLQVGDVISRIWRKKMHEIGPSTSIEYVKRKLAGPPNSSCGFTIIRNGQELPRFNLTRKPYNLPGSGGGRPATGTTGSSQSSLEDPALYAYLQDKLSRPKYPPQGAKQPAKQGAPAQAPRQKAANQPPPKPQQVPPKPKVAPPKNAQPQKKPAVGSGYPANEAPRAAPNKVKGAQYYGVGLHIQRVPNGFQVSDLTCLRSRCGCVGLTARRVLAGAEPAGRRGGGADGGHRQGRRHGADRRP